MARANWTAFLIFAIVSTPISWAQQKGWYQQTSGTLQASPLVMDLDNDSRQEIIVPDFMNKLFIYKHDGTRWKTSIPFTFGSAGGDGTMGSAAVGDVNDDGANEIVIVTDDTAAVNATVLVYDMNGNFKTSKPLYVTAGTASGKATPCLIDCYRYDSSTTHTAKEILVRDGDGRMHVLYWTSSDTLADLSDTYFNTCTSDAQRDMEGRHPITSSVAAVALDSERTLIAVGSTDGMLHAWTVSSSQSANWHMIVHRQLATSSTATRFYGSPTIADVDDNSKYEIVAGANDGKVYMWDEDGKPEAGWPCDTGQAIYASPAVADLDGSGSLEVIVGSSNGGIFVWNHNGTDWRGWKGPQFSTLGNVFASPVAGEIDGNPGLEIVAASLDGYLYAWDPNTNETDKRVPGWPKRIGTPLYSSPAIANLHGGERLAVIACDFNGRVYVFDMPRPSVDPDKGWLQFRGNARRTGTSN